MPKVITKEEFVEKANEIHNNQYDYSKVSYVGAKTPIIIIDEFDFEHLQTPDNHLNGYKLSIQSVIDKKKYFVFFANKMHNNQYDYSKVIYVDAKTPVMIIDEYGFEHLRTPDNHLKGRKLSIQSVIDKNKYFEFFANKMHNNQYDYSKVIYVDAKTPVMIIDEYGFEHLQIPSNHLKGCKLSIQSVIDKNKYFEFFANKMHNNQYDYSKVIYENINTPVIIKCLEHNYEFKQTPHSHLQSAGCPICGGTSKSTKEDFIEKANKIHNNKYDYSKVIYVDNKTPVIIIDEFGFEHLQIPSSHLMGKKLTIQSAINKTEYFKLFANKKHGNKYDYSKVDYIGSDTPVIIKCLEHNYEFKQTPNNHLRSQGCPICGLGFTKSYKLELINTLENSDLLTMDAIELLLIINQGKLPQEFDALITSESYSDERIATINELREHFSNEDEESINAEEITSEIEENDVFTTVDDVDNEIIIESPLLDDEEDDKPSLPVVRIVDDLRMLDNEIYAKMDEEVFTTLVEYKLRKLWNNVLNNNISYEDILKEEGSKYFTLIKSTFIEEYNNVINYEPKGCYSFPFKPNLMQKLTVHRLLNNKSYGNWSGTGAGKTLSFILASREIDARVTLVVAVNSTIEQTKNSILEVYPDSNVFIEYNNEVFDRSKHNYLIMNYEKFQQEYSEELCQALTNNNQIDLIVVDEVHSVKQRTEQIESLRHEVINKMFGRIRENNPNCYTLLMSATPVINDLFEAKSLLKLMTGLEYDDINTRRTINNAINLFIQLTTNGIRFIPKYQVDIDELTGHNMTNLNIDGSHLIDGLLEISKGSFTQAEVLLLDDKLNAIHSYLKKGTVIYSYYTTDIVDRIKNFVKQQGFTCETYTGEESPEFRKNTLSNFINGQTDILIGSKPIGTGVDGLQTVCDRMIIITLPWTDSEYTQLKGRIYRQGSIFNNVEIIIPQVKIKMDDDNVWSWDIQRLNLIKNKRTLADCAVDGVIPSRIIPTMETMYNKCIESLSNWKERISQGNIIENDRKKTVIDLYPDVTNEDEIKTRIESEINEVHRKANTSYSSTTHKEFTNNPESFFRYHQLRNQRMEKWEEIPYEYIATKIKNRNHIVADFGCGENKFKDCIPHNKVYSFDHVAFDDTVVACDMKNTPLENESIDDAVFSLSLWGINYEDYIKEAYRILNYGGTIYISEPSNKYTTEEKENLKSLLIKNNFKIIGDIEIRGKFFYLRGFKE